MSAAVLLSVAPFAARPFLRASVDALDAVQAGAFLGSLLGVLVLVSVPVMLLGAAAPYAIRLAVSDIERSGEVAGRLYAVSTAGSLVGTMLSALLPIPFAATQRTFLFSASARMPRRVLMLGNAAGSVARAYGHYLPRTWLDAVEIDGELTALGRRYFGLRNARMHTYTEDARPFLASTDRRYDALMVDVYRQPYIPFYLTTREFFEQARERLAPGGTVIVNVGHPEGNSDLERVLGRTLTAVFPIVRREPIEPENTLLIASEHSLSARRLRLSTRSMPPKIRRLATRVAGQLAPRLPGGEVYTDDRAPVEWLVDRSILGYANGR